MQVCRPTRHRLEAIEKMKRRTIITKVLVLVMALSLLVGAACTVNVGEQGEGGVGVESIVDNGNGTFTITLTDGSSFTTDNLTGPQGARGGEGDKGDAGAGGPQMTAHDGRTEIEFQWDSGQGTFLIDPDRLPSLQGSGLSAGKMVHIYLVVSPTTSIPLATATTNSIGCFYTDESEIKDAGVPIQVAPDANLDWPNGGKVFRVCYFEAVVDGQQAATLPIVLTGWESDVGSANAELVTAQAAIESTLAEANAASFTTYGPWDGTRATSPTATNGSTTVYASDMLRSPHFRATYSVNMSGDIVSASLTPAPGYTAWVGIAWDSGTHKWVANPPLSGS